MKFSINEFEANLVIDDWVISYEIAFKWLSLGAPFTNMV